MKKEIYELAIKLLEQGTENHVIYLSEMKQFYEEMDMSVYPLTDFEEVMDFLVEVIELYEKVEPHE